MTENIDTFIYTFKSGKYYGHGLVVHSFFVPVDKYILGESTLPPQVGFLTRCPKNEVKGHLFLDSTEFGNS